VRSNPSKVAVVTGGASGLGLAITSRFAQEGFAVCVLARNYSAAQSVVADITSRNGCALAVQVDISNYASIVNAFDLCMKEFSRIDVVVCNAGVCEVLPFFDVGPDDWDRAFDVNARGLFFCNQVAGKAMRETGGRIINIGSPASRMGLPYYAVYAASKAAVDSITRSAAIALAEFNIKVNCLSPGRMDTPMQERCERSLAEYTGIDYEELVDSRTRSLPLKRRVAIEEIAEAALFLAGASSDFMTGSRLNITGGQELS
jgi:NAD(P)-dependent dehydrogenase (short-subunit alcohol dehydrogenase family)